MGPAFPGEETDDPGLEDEDYADAGVEAAEIGRHSCYVERRAFGEAMGGGGFFVGGEVFGGDHLLEESEYVRFCRLSGCYVCTSQAVDLGEMCQYLMFSFLCSPSYWRYASSVYLVSSLALRHFLPHLRGHDRTR